MFSKITTVSKIYFILSGLLLLVGFLGLFSKSCDYKIPYISDTLIEALDKQSVSVNTLRGPSTIMKGDQWFFAIILGIVIGLGLITAVINQFIHAYEGRRPKQVEPEG